MEYSMNQFSKIAGVSTRTLRYYDEIGLLKPLRVNLSGYRIYGTVEVERLQQILFFRELGVNLNKIKEIITAPDFDQMKTLENHLTQLYIQQKQLELLINNVKKTISAMKGEIVMNDKEKFEGFKQKLVEENEEKYGKEIREKYGDNIVNNSNSKVKNMTKEQYKEIEELNKQLEETLRAAFKEGDPAGELAQKACELHKRWLCFFIDHYNKEYHKSLGQMYADDERFTKYYDKIIPGCTSFFRDAIDIFCQ